MEVKDRCYFTFAINFWIGFVEFIESQSVANVISENGSILKYFQRISANRSAFKDIISTFTRSCGKCGVKNLPNHWGHIRRCTFISWDGIYFFKWKNDCLGFLNFGQKRSCFFTCTRSFWDRMTRIFRDIQIPWKFIFFERNGQKCEENVPKKTNGTKIRT